MRLQPGLQPGLDPLTRGTGQLLIRQETDLRFQHPFAGCDAGHHFPEPTQCAILRQSEGIIHTVDHPLGAVVEFLRQSLGRCGPQGFGLGSAGLRIGHKLKALQMANDMTFDRNFARC